MSELKSFIVRYNGKFIRAYEESEADKVIAELEERIADGDKDFEIANHQNEKLLKIVRRYKYKRCLAMARIAQDDWHLHNSFYAMGHKEFEKRKCEFYDKWHKRWLKIAEKFKPNPTINIKGGTNALQR